MPPLSVTFVNDSVAVPVSAGNLNAMVAAINAAGGANMGTPVTTVSNGTTATTAWVRDAVLGNYVFTAIAGRRYQARVNNMQASSTVAGDSVLFAICNGGASTPTPGNGIVANSYVSPPTTASGINVPLSGTFVPGAGVQTLAVCLIRTGGTGTTTPLSVSGGAPRELFVVDIGPA